MNIKNKAIVDLQLGDVGKGRIVDYFANDYDYVCRYQGGGNAGHTLYYKGKKVVLHHIPCGILHPKVKVVLGRGMLLNVAGFFSEIDSLIKLGFKEKDLQKRIFIDDCIHIVEHKHIYQDVSNISKIGSTGQGIGPCYADKAARTGLRLKDCVGGGYNFRFCKKLKPYIKYPNDLSASKVLCEGAQSIMLDISYGEYPYVTSSHTLPQYIPMGLKDSPRSFRHVGVFKAYLTKVSAKGFPTELKGKEETQLRTLGSEFGATTGRPRRVGWLDLPQLKESIKIGFIDELIITKVDIINQMKQVKVAYKYHKGNPVYKTFVPWKTCSMKDKQFKAFIEFIESELKMKINYISTGPNRGDIYERT